MVRGYVLIEAEVGRAKSVGEKIQALDSDFAKVVSTDTVTGPYDLIVQLQSDDLDRLGNCITGEIQNIEGVDRTTTCLAVKLG